MPRDTREIQTVPLDPEDASPPPPAPAPPPPAPPDGPPAPIITPATPFTQREWQVFSLLLGSLRAAAEQPHFLDRANSSVRLVLKAMEFHATYAETVAREQQEIDRLKAARAAAAEQFAREQAEHQAVLRDLCALTAVVQDLQAAQQLFLDTRARCEAEQERLRDLQAKVQRLDETVALTQAASALAR